MSRRPAFLERLRARPLMFDGAMGTMIYQRGVFLNACYDELCLTQPKLILDIHGEYVEAGAEVIETNSFGANRFKLEYYGLADKLEAINSAAAGLAREAAGESVYVAGSVGPCLPPEQALTPANRDSVADAFFEQTSVLARAGADLILLETFHDIEQLQLAAAMARRTGAPVIASFTVGTLFQRDERQRPESEFAKRLEADPNVDAIGINCGMGPADLFHPLRRMMEVASKPVVVMPNAGGPREVGGRMLYLNSPEYFTEFCKRYVELGVRGVGGCCGTTPAHIRMAARAIKTMSGVKEHIAIAARPAEQAGVASPRAGCAVATADKSAFAAGLCAGKKATSVELLPPPSGAGLASFLKKCRACQDAGVDAINLPDGPRASARMSVMATCFAMMREGLGIEPIPHYCCRDRNLIGMQSDLLGGCALGLKNWLFITGDPPKLGNYPDASGVFDLDSIGLARLADNLNHGYDAAGQAIGQATAMLIGVGANPAAVEMEREIERYFRKIDAGAEYAITQPIFDADILLRFLDRIHKYDRGIFVIAGLYPLVSFRNADFMNRHVPGVTVPDGILERMGRCKSKEDGLKTGAEIAREIRERIEDSVSGFQASAPLGRIDIALEVLK